MRAACCLAPSTALGGVVDSGRVDSTLFALFIAFVFLAGAISLGFVALARGRHPKRLSMLRAAGAESAFALGAVAYVVLTGASRGFASLESAILIAGGFLVAASTGLVVYVIARRRDPQAEKAERARQP